MKQIVMIFMTIFALIGAYLPLLFGDNDIFSLWSILGGFVGGMIGICAGVQVYKRWL